MKSIKKRLLKLERMRVSSISSIEHQQIVDDVQQLFADEYIMPPGFVIQSTHEQHEQIARDIERQFATYDEDRSGQGEILQATIASIGGGG